MCFYSRVFDRTHSSRPLPTTLWTDPEINSPNIHLYCPQFFFIYTLGDVSILLLFNRQSVRLFLSHQWTHITSSLRGHHSIVRPTYVGTVTFLL